MRFRVVEMRTASTRRCSGTGELYWESATAVLTYESACALVVNFAWGTIEPFAPTFTLKGIASLQKNDLAYEKDDFSH